MNKNTPCDESIHSQVDNIIQQIRTGEVSDDARQILLTSSMRHPREIA